MSGARAARRRTASALALMLALGMGGCAVGPDYETPDLVMPTHWGSGRGAKAEAEPHLARWWRRLGDPLLDTLMDEAVAGNLDVATAKAKVRAARASYRQEVGSLFPQVTGNASATRGDNGGNISSGGDVTVATTYTEFQAGFDASWELDLFGANRRGVEAAAYAVDAAINDLDAALLTLVGDIASNYIDARGYQARAALARRTAASQRETAALTQRKLDAGGASAVDVANATGQAASTEAAIPELEASFAASVHRLSVLTGRPPAALTERLARARPIPAPRLPVPRGIPANVLVNRPDVRSAERQLAQSTALVAQAEANRYPSVSLTGALNTTGDKVGDLARGSSISWSFGPTLTVPIFTGGQLQAAEQLAEAQRDQSFLAYQAAVLTALEDVENASVSLAQQRIKAKSLAAAAASYREATRLSRSLYENGASSFLDVLVAERSLYTADDSLLQSRAAIAKYYVALNKALGGGWDGVVDTATPVVVDRNTGPRLAPLPISAMTAAAAAQIAPPPAAPPSAAPAKTQ